jgi:outer membrane protein assembly factor BamB
LALGFSSRSADAQEWSRFRGPNGSGETETSMPGEWTAKDYRWRIETPGIGHSSASVWGDRVFLNSGDPDSGSRFVLCYDGKTGKLLWKREFKSPKHHLHDRNSYGTGTPALDADRCYVAWANPDEYTLMALTHDGETVWKISLGLFNSEHGFGTSPIVYQDMVVLANEQKGPSFLLAVDSATGKTRWKTDRPFRRTAYGTPIVYSPAGKKDQLIFTGGRNGIQSVDPTTGTLNWNVEAFDKRTVGSAIVVGDVILAACGSGGGGNYTVGVVPPDDREANAQPKVIYKIDRQSPYVPTPVAAGNLVFLWSDRGVVTCIDAPTGDKVWQHRVGNNFSASPIRCADRIYCPAEDGELFVIAASDKYEPISRIQLGEPTRATPAVSGGRMYLRTYSHLMALDGEK